MKALSVRAPWWWFILYSGKDIENRDWPTGFRGTVLLHASKWWNAREVQDDFDYAVTCWEGANDTTETTSLFEPQQVAKTIALMRSRGGCIVGSVDIVGCVKQSNSPWFCGEYGFVLANPRYFAEPFPCRGQLGFFDVEIPAAAVL